MSWTIAELKKIVVLAGLATEADVNGFNWRDLLKLAWPYIEKILLGLLAAPKGVAPTLGCCDHGACCDKVIKAQLAALQAAIEHKLCCECDDAC